MNFDRCEHCEHVIQRMSEMRRHVKFCSIRLKRTRRVISRSMNFLFNNMNSNERKKRRTSTLENNNQKNEIFNLTNEIFSFDLNATNIDEQQ